MGTPHKWADAIKAFADGEAIERRSKYSPEPWKICHSVDGSGDIAIIDAEGYIIAEAFSDIRCDGESSPEVEGNARLLAAAPKLLGALRFILAFYEPGQTVLDTEAWKQAEASGWAAVAAAESTTKDLS